MSDGTIIRVTRSGGRGVEIRKEKHHLPARAPTKNERGEGSTHHEWMNMSIEKSRSRVLGWSTCYMSQWGANGEEPWGNGGGEGLASGARGVTIANSYYLLAMPNSLISSSQDEEGILHAMAWPTLD